MVSAVSMQGLVGLDNASRGRNAVPPLGLEEKHNVVLAFWDGSERLVKTDCSHVALIGNHPNLFAPRLGR
jgi:hypothetical protein